MSGNGAARGRRLRRLTLAFQHHDAVKHVGDPLHEDLSACARIGETLFVSCDETAGVDRLVARKKNRWEHDAHFNLGEMFNLPAGPEGEMDIEGLEAEGGYLWIVGSHSLKRDTPDDDDSPADALKAMEDVDRDPNRYFLGRVPLRQGEDGAWELVRKHEGRKAAALKMKKKKSRLLKWLRGDPLLDRFLAIPSKENGIDIEGLAAKGDRVWLGLRGPAIRGHAVILELSLKVTGSGHLKARRIDGGRRYRKYMLDSAGLGIRDLLLDGQDLLIMLGPTMSSDGPARVLRWRGATRDTHSSMIRGERVSVACELPYKGQYDHPEGMAHWPEEGERSFLVVYDAPAPARLNGGSTQVAADVMRFAD